MTFTPDQIESLNMLGYFKDPSTADFVCGIVGCESKVKASSDLYFLITSATNTCSISPKSSFDFLVDSILDLQDSCQETEEFERKDTWNTAESILCSTYILAKSKKNKKKSSRDMTDNLLRVKSSNVWAYAYNAQLDYDVSDLFVQFKGKDGGPGDIYQYYAVPLKIWHKFISAPSKGHFFWKYIRNKYKYRKLTGDKKGKLPNAVN